MSNLTNFIVIPFFLQIYPKLTENVLDNRPEFIYNVKKTIEVFRDPHQTTEINTSIRCHVVPPESLYCQLRDINFFTKLEYKNPTRKIETTGHTYYVQEWFQIEFSQSGVKHVLVNKGSNDDTIEIIKEIAYQFDVGNDLKNMSLTCMWQTLPAKERTIVGTCRTLYNVSFALDRNATKEKFDFQLILSEQEHFPGVDKKNLVLADLRVHIEKQRWRCQYYPDFIDFLNGMQVIKHDHTMEIFRDKFNIITRLNVRIPPNAWQTSEAPVFNEIMQLNLIEINAKNNLDSLDSFNNYVWVQI